MVESTLWWVLAGVAVAAELVTGTFYLLMLGVGLAAGAVAAHAGLPLGWQLLAVALVSVAAIGALHRRRARRVAPAPAGANRDVILDVGERLVIEAWSPDGTARVKYRGADWTATPVPGAPLATGPHKVREVVGNRLVVEKI